MSKSSNTLDFFTSILDALNPASAYHCPSFEDFMEVLNSDEKDAESALVRVARSTKDCCAKVAHDAIAVDVADHDKMREALLSEGVDPAYADFERTLLIIYNDHDHTVQRIMVDYEGLKQHQTHVNEAVAWYDEFFRLRAMNHEAHS